MNRRVASGIVALACIASACAGAPHARRTAPGTGKPRPGAGSGGVVASVEHHEVVVRGTDRRIRWSVRIDGGSIGAAAVSGDRVFVASTNDDGSGSCKGLDLATGATRWTYEYLGAAAVGVARASDLAICVMADGVTVAVAPESGFVIWQFTFASDIPASQVMVPDRTPMAVDGAAGLFTFTVRIAGVWFRSSRDIETGHTRDLALAPDPGG